MACHRHKAHLTAQLCTHCQTSIGSSTSCPTNSRWLTQKSTYSALFMVATCQLIQLHARPGSVGLQLNAALPMHIRMQQQLQQCVIGPRIELWLLDFTCFWRCWGPWVTRTGVLTPTGDRLYLVYELQHILHHDMRPHRELHLPLQRLHLDQLVSGRPAQRAEEEAVLPPSVKALRLYLLEQSWTTALRACVSLRGTAVGSQEQEGFPPLVTGEGMAPFRRDR